MPTNQLATFREPWDSEATANWPVTEPLALMSNLAYLPPHSVNGAFALLGFIKTQSFAWGSMVAYMVSGEDVVAVAFRGTDNIPDWFVNLNILSKETPHGSIHEGFAETYDQIAKNLADAVKNSGAKHVWITGHSLGGALALVCSYDFLEVKHLPVTGLITFGQPMVAKANLARYLEQKLLGKYAHLVNGADIVTRVPPSYAHCGSLVWFSDGKVYRSRQKRPNFGTRSLMEHDLPESDELRPLTEAEFEMQQRLVKVHRDRMMVQLDSTMQVDGALNVLGNLPFLDDHKMDHYVNKVRKYILNKHAGTPASFGNGP